MGRVFVPFCTPRSRLARAIRRAAPPARHAQICTSPHAGMYGPPCSERPREILWHNCAGCGGGPLGAPWISSCEVCHPGPDGRP